MSLCNLVYTILLQQDMIQEMGYLLLVPELVNLLCVSNKVLCKNKDLRVMLHWGWQSYYHATVIKRWKDRQRRLWANQTTLPLQTVMNTGFRQTHVVLPYCIISKISTAAFALARKHFLMVDYEKK